MKKLLIILFLMFCSNGYSQEDNFWKYLWGPNTGYIYTVKINQDNDIFIGTDNGIFRSTNDGQNWKHIINYYDTKEFAISSTGLFYTRGVKDIDDCFLIYSSDNGETWKQLTGSFELSCPFGLNFDKNDNLYFIDHNTHDSLSTYFSSDFGIIWRKNVFKHNLTSDFINLYITVDSNGVIAVGGYYKVDQNYNGVIFISKDKGKSWEKITGIPSVKCFQFINDSTLLVGTTRGLFFTYDLGETWSNTIFNSHVEDILFSKDGNLYVSSYGFFYSSDLGKTWEKNSEASIGSICRNSEGKIFGRRYASLVFSEDNGRNWIQSNSGFTAADVKDIAFDSKGNDYAVDRGVHKSTDDGNTWECIGLSYKNCTNIIINDIGYIFVGVSGENLYLSKDDGKTWINLGLYYPSGISVPVVDLFINKRGHIFVGHIFTGFYRSTDNGDTWKDEEPDNDASLCFARNSEGDIFRGSRRGVIYRSTDDGDTWEMVQDQLPSSCEKLSEMVFNPRSNIGYTQCGLKTTDNGRTWSDVHNITEEYYGSKWAVDSVGNFYVTGYRVYRTTNEGKEWLRIDKELKHHYYKKVAVSPNGYVYLSAERGGLYRSKEPMVSVEEKPKTDNSVALTVTPNPFPEEAVTNYKLSDPSNVILKVYDALGIEVAVLVKEFQDAGNHQAVFDGSSLAPGIYYYTLQIGGSVKSGMMVLLR